MRAEVEIAAVPEELDGMTARIASADAFKRANIEYDAALSSVRMAVERRAGNNAVVRITSDRPFSEPFVDILIELNWQGGRLLREYTFLLDPADIAEQKTPAPAVGTVTQPDVGARPAPASRSAQAAESAPQRSAASRPAARRQAEAPKAPAEKPAATETTSAENYEVKKGDTPIGIANSLKESGVSSQQMLAALYKANQDAFINGNINRLRAGRILKVPAASEAQTLSAAQAREIILNASNFDGYRQAVASAAAEGPAQQPAASQSAGGKIAPKVAEPAPSAATNQGQLKISQSRDGKPSEAEKNAAARVQTLQEELASRNKALSDANSRLAELEKNVKELQKLVELKNQNLADVQKQAEAAKAANKKAETAAQQAQKDAEAAKVAAAKQAEEAKAAAAKQAEEAKAAAAREADEARRAAAAAEEARVAAAAKAEEDAKAAAAAAAAAVAATPASEPTAPVITEQVASEPVPVQPAPQVETPPTPQPAPVVVEEEEGLLSSPLALGGLLIAALGAGYVVLRNRRRNAKNGGLTMSALSEASTSPNSVFGNAGGQTVDTGTSVLHTDFSQSGLSAIDTDEGVDPVAEADVYMAYGRDAQAEEILLDALKNDPSRAAIYVKLLEIYAQRRSVKQFENIATDLYTQTGGAGDDWAKAAALGARLDPTNPLYRSGAAAEQAPSDGVPSIEAAVAGSAVGALAAGAAAESVADQIEQVAAAEEAPAQGVTFGTNNVSQMRATWTVPGEINQFDTSGGDIPVLPDAPAESSAAPEPLNLDFNLDLELPEGDEPETQMEPRDIDEPSLPAVDEITPEPGSVKLTDSMSPLEFDIDLGVETEPDLPAAISAPAPAAPVEPVSAAEEANDLDLGIERAMEKTTLAVVDLEKTNFEGSLLDFDFELGDESRPDDRSLDLSSVNLRTDGGLGGGAAAASFEPSGDVALAEPPASVAGSEDLAEIDLNDEVTTKLELARAYEEMGDLEGARELLEEVLADGADPQKEMAKTILSRIS